MVSSSIYISRKAARRFVDDFEASISLPRSEDGPILHHVYGIGGVGKSTLLQYVRDTYAKDVLFVTATFDSSTLIDGPLSLMDHLYSKLPRNEWGDETFTAQYKLFEETRRQLETEPENKRGTVSPEQTALVKKLVGTAAMFAATKLNLSEKDANDVKGVAEDVASVAISEKDKFEQLLKKHWATKKKKALQELMLDPIGTLTQAFAAGVIEKAKIRPVVMVLDTYEKASSEFDAFLCKYVIGNAFNRSHAVRFISAGRYSLKNKKYQKRIFQSLGELVCENNLEKFSKSETKAYLKEAGIKDADVGRRIFSVTKGLPYYLKLFRDQHDRGEKISFSRGRDEIADRLLYGHDDDVKTNEFAKQVVQLAAHCRWFDRPLIQYLIQDIEEKDGGGQLASMDWFDWLKGRDFVIEDEHYRIDDVARDVIRAALCRDDEQSFRATHKRLTDYFDLLADGVAGLDSPVPERYEDSDWIKHTTEAVYHSLFVSRSEGQTRLLTSFFEGAHFDQPTIALNAFTAAVFEMDLDDNALLPADTKKVLSSIGPAITLGWQVIGMHPDKYEYKVRLGESTEAEKSIAPKNQIENALSKCFRKGNAVKGLAEYVKLQGEAVRCQRFSIRMKYLERSIIVAEDLIFPNYPKFSCNLFFNIGTGFNSIGAHEKELISFKTAAEIDPESYAAWTMQGCALDTLERYEEALTAYNKAIDIDETRFEAWNNKGSTLILLCRYNEALSSLERAIELNPNADLSWKNKGRALESMENYEEALFCFNKAIEVRTETDLVHEVSRVDSLRMLERYEEAIDYCDRFLSYNNNKMADFWNMKSLCLSLLKKHNEADFCSEKAILTAKTEDEVFATANRCIVLARAGNIENALALCEKYLRKNKDEYGYYAQSCCYAILGDNELSIQSLKFAIELRPNQCKREARANPDFDELRQSEEFQALVAL